MGRRPHSKQSHDLNGNPSKLATVKQHPSIAGGSLSPPSWLDKIGKAYWNRIAPVLRDAGLFGESDTETLGMLCQAYSDYRECIERIRKEGKTVPTENGSVKPNPLVAMMKVFADLHTRLSGEFGLTPAARSKMTLEPIDDEDPLDQFIGKMGA